MKDSSKKYHRVCIFLNDEEKEKLYLAVYTEKTSPAKIFRKALMSYIDKVLCNGVTGMKETEIKDNKSIVL